MPSPDDHEVRIFPVETRFQKLATQPGGLSREEALRNATAAIGNVKPGFDEWANERLQQLTEIIRAVQNDTAPADWIKQATTLTLALRDVGATMNYALLSAIANSLGEVLDTVAAGVTGDYVDPVVCHLDALLLARQEPYRFMRPDQVPELTDGLRRVADQIGTTIQDQPADE
jgi:hypothetical protein